MNEALERFENWHREKGKWPLKFGDQQAIQRLQEIDEESKLCPNCEGEGTVQCAPCNGTGKKVGSDAERV